MAKELTFIQKNFKLLYHKKKAHIVQILGKVVPCDSNVWEFSVTFLELRQDAITRVSFGNIHILLSLSMYTYFCLCILIVVYVYLLLSMYTYRCLCILIVVYIFLLFVHVFLSLSMYTYCCPRILRRGYPD